MLRREHPPLQVFTRQAAAPVISRFSRRPEISDGGFVQWCSVARTQQTRTGLARNNGKKTSKSREREEANGAGEEQKEQLEMSKRHSLYFVTEAEEGNIEYKPKLVNPTQYRFEHLATQLAALRGRGQAAHQIGVEDNVLAGRPDRKADEGPAKTQRGWQRLESRHHSSEEREVTTTWTETLENCRSARSKVPDDQQFLTCGQCWGNVDWEVDHSPDEGELTITGRRARLNLFRHSARDPDRRTHISFEILGFKQQRRATALTSPAMLVVSANTGIWNLCPHPERTVRAQLSESQQPGCNKVPMVVAPNGFDACHRLAQQFTQSVFLNILPPLSNSKEQEELMQQLTEFQVDEIYSVPDVGTVVGGTLYSGVCREGERLVVGPTDEGRFLRLKVGSIQRNRSACRVLRAGQAATLALGNFDRSLLRKGMVMVSPKMNPTICCQFEAAIVLLFHAKTFRRGSQVTVHVGNVRQTATVECLHGKDELRTGERAVVRFRFIKHPEYLRLGAKLLFREGVTKGIGHVTRLLPPFQNHDQNQNQNHDQNLQEH
ncbi:GTP-binding protein 2-like protein [Lates japonicus]|uniref:GTP-binding protein 2-like protein n=1 Tax=Lates japonicus TaxID=270547 RepID=A0AAD3N4T6_LATJO|nr:GTP-binding protein 2-like protein [Lates japonicus]